MPTIVRRPYVAATLAGAPVGPIISARYSCGFDQRIAEAHITVATKPVAGSYWDSVQLQVGANHSSSAVRFTGCLLEYDYALWPQAVTLVCKGNLYRAARFENTDNLGTDLSNAGAGQSDQAMVKQILAAVPGLSYVPGNIGGTGKVLGTRTFDVFNSGFGNVFTGPFTWGGPGLLNQTVGETALAAIDRIDAISEGWRLFETTGGVIYRFRISGRPRASSDVPQFNEGVDIFSGSGQRTLIPARNKFVVNGYDFGTGIPITTYTQLSSPFTPGLDQSMSLSSTMIEKARELDAPGANIGQSCAAVAAYLNGEFNREIVKLTMTTPRDDVIGPGQVHAVYSPRLGITEPLWVLHVDGEITEQGVFSQTMTYVGGGLPDTAASPPV